MVERVDGLIARAGWRAALPIVAAALIVVILAALLGREAWHHVLAFEAWIADLGPWGHVIFVCLLVAATSFFVPESLFGIAAGALFGVRVGFLTLAIGNIIAAVVQYALARWLLRARIRHMLAHRPKLAAVQRAVLKDETRLQLLLRLTPLNSASLSYVFGATGVRFGGFLFACIGLIPHVLLEVYLGHTGQRLTHLSVGMGHHSLAHELMTLSGLLVSAIVVFVISRIARNAIERVMAGEER